MRFARLKNVIRPHLGAASWRLQPARTRRVAILLVLVLIGGISVAGLAITRFAHAQTPGDPYTWGTNAFGTLGVGNFNAPSGPTPNHLTSISAGIASVVSGQAANDALAVGADGSLWGWGDNNEHEITPDAVQQYAAPVQVPNISGVTAAAAGNGFTLALKSDGTVWAWGTTQFGLGDGTHNVSATPVQVAFQLPAGVTIKAIAAGSIHSLAVDSTGNVWAWGYNGDGELGNGLTTNSAVPVQATMPSGVTFTAVAAGQSHSLGLGSNGTVYAWGANASGQLGLGSSTPALTPSAVSGVSGATSIAAGQIFSVVGTSSGAFTFGDNFEGELGNGSTTNSMVPVQVSGLSGNVTAVAAGDNHALALGADGTVYAWGFDNDGQVGPNGGANACGRFGADPCSTSAVTVTGVSGASGVAAGTQFSLAAVPSAVPVAGLNATSVSFGNQVQGTASATQSIIVTNTGGGSLNIGTLSITGTNASDFSASGCTGQSLSAGATCTMSITFTPGGIGSRSASLSISDNDAHSPQSVTLSGNGTYSWSGVQSPNGNTFRAGTKISLQFQLTGASAGIKTTVANAFFAPVVNGTPGTYTATTGVPPGSGNTFSFTSKQGGGYTYTWSTKGLSAGTYSLEVTLDDGTTGLLTITLT
jgi:alpha-tubulin suppressor-like RCC1 family protein